MTMQQLIGGFVLGMLAGSAHADEAARLRAELRAQQARPPAVAVIAARVGDALASAAVARMAGIGPGDVQLAPEARLAAAAPPLSSAWISASTDSAIDSGESAPMSIPTGPLSRERSAAPRSPSASSNR